ncbi:DUF6233 domain-containing protein [Streptomyces sp. F8]|uniref:DUF6233 domain-containing protein n=1 Tax=Streptomyces sp. F8 TaxID=1436085 RepID=UPI0029CBAA4A|nr:DUF6233 domain-containing protein [Streptomyces sp. F8]MDX6764131.1 DUF6233 domain-containing protein [Streptomyces sp. F8]
MSELPPDLLRLGTIVTYLRHELGRAERALAAAEATAAAAAAARSRPRPDAPAWVIEQGIGDGRPPVSVHAGDCWDRGRRWRPLSAEEARRALSEGVTACTHCRPDTALGVID